MKYVVLQKTNFPRGRDIGFIILDSTIFLKKKKKSENNGTTKSRQNDSGM